MRSFIERSRRFFATAAVLCIATAPRPAQGSPNRAKPATEQPVVAGYQLFMFTEPRSGSHWLSTLLINSNPCVYSVMEGSQDQNVALQALAGLPAAHGKNVTAALENAHLDNLFHTWKGSNLGLQKFKGCPATLAHHKTFCPLDKSLKSTNFTSSLGAAFNKLKNTSVLLLIRRNGFEQYVSRHRGYTHCVKEPCISNVKNRKVQVNLKGLRQAIDGHDEQSRQCLGNVTRSGVRSRVVYYEDLIARPKEEVQEELLRFATHGALGRASMSLRQAKPEMAKSSDPSNFDETIENWPQVAAAMKAWGPYYNGLIHESLRREGAGSDALSAST